MTNTPKPPMVIYARRQHPSTDLDGNIISENWTATTSDHPLMSGEIYVHLDQFLEETEKRATKIEKRLNLTIGDWNPSTGIALWELTNELKEHNGNHEQS